jgi:hypothetical protein
MNLILGLTLSAALFGLGAVYVLPRVLDGLNRILPAEIQGRQVTTILVNGVAFMVVILVAGAVLKFAKRGL